MEWLKQQGPWCAGADRLPQARSISNYDVLIFFTYLYAPTVLGLKVAPAKSILVPTAHDEPAIKLGDIQGSVFSCSPRSVISRRASASSSRNAMASSSTRTASITGTTGRASNTKAGNIEQNL